MLPVKRTTSAASKVALGAAVWVAESAGSGTYRRFAAALQLCSDDVGLINETQLEAIAAEQDWPIPLPDLIEACHLVQLSGCLAMADTAAAAAKSGPVEKRSRKHRATQASHRALLRGDRGRFRPLRIRAEDQPGHTQRPRRVRKQFPSNRS